MNYKDAAVGKIATGCTDTKTYPGIICAISDEQDVYPITIKTVDGLFVSFRADEVTLETNTIVSNSNPTLVEEKTVLPTDATERKKYPIGTGVIDYFPAALAEVAKVSYQGNQQHNPGQPLHWARNKSTDQADTIMRHYIERGGFDVDGQRHSAKLAWRALALLQLELEAEGAPVARGASYEEEKK